jgi:peptidoglycan-N-acetylglucosamine deacetylase
MSIDDIVRLNGLSDANYLYVGQELKVGGGAVVVADRVPAVTPISTNVATRSHTVQSGDTLYGIAGKFGTTVDAVVKANGLANADFISVGQTLAIP